MFHALFDIPYVQGVQLCKVPLLEWARTPLVVNAAVLGVLIVLLFRRESVRLGLTIFSAALLVLATGLLFAAGILIACVTVYLLACLLWKWGERRPHSWLPMAAAWLVINSLLLPCFFVKLPEFGPFMEWGELTQFWGLCFFTLRALHYQRQVLRGGVDPRGAAGFAKYLHYMIHAPNFSFGPYQTFRQFTYEVDTCRDRLTWKNIRYGGWRILLAVAKGFLLFEFIQRKFFYRYEYYGPFARHLFLDLDAHTTGELWLFALLFMLRIYLFISALSDGVIGMNWMMGIRVPENFQQPLLATNVIDFWRRWHCGVGTFLRDEIFLPIGGTDHRLRGYLATFLYCGFWHFPFFGALVLFPLLQTGLFMLTHAWIDLCRAIKKSRPHLHELARRMYVIESLPSRLAGRAFTSLAFMVSCLLVFDHQTSGLPMLARLFGLRHQRMLTQSIAQPATAAPLVRMAGNQPNQQE